MQIRVMKKSGSSNRVLNEIEGNFTTELFIKTAAK
jgi:hypothetical protein